MCLRLALSLMDILLLAKKNKEKVVKLIQLRVASVGYLSINLS
jgi:hypothetical protein